VIRTFKSKALAAFWQRGDVSRLDARTLSKLKLRLSRLDVAVTPVEMDAPRYDFHALKGDRQNVFSVRITGNWRLTFGWDGADAIDVDLEDYH